MLRRRDQQSSKETSGGISRPDADISAPPAQQRRRALFFQIYVITTIFLFAGLALLARTQAYLDIDLFISRFLQSFDAPWFAALMAAVSWPGFAPQALLVIGIFSLLVFWLGEPWEGVVSLAATGAVQALNFLVKLLVARPRPSADLVSVVEELASYSFPSGHVMFYTAFFGFLYFLTFSLLRRSLRRTLLLFFFGSLVVLVGPSRIYLGQHWASDVLGGYLLGSLTLAVVILVYRWGKERSFLQSGANPDTGR